MRAVVSHLVGVQEARTIRRSQLIISCAEELSAQLKWNFSLHEKQLVTIPMGFDLLTTHGHRSPEVSDTNRVNVIFHGGLEHHPNREAADLIIKKIAPAVLQRNPTIHFYVVGRGNPDETRRNVTRLGFVDELDALMDRMHIAIMPIVSGSGIRVKAMDYIRHQLPMVSTRLGLEGYPFGPSECVKTRAVDDLFVDAILRLAASGELRHNLGTRCLEKATHELSNDVLAIRLKKVLEKSGML
jgi:glycosyltransferase involved in cell wall biosynthesis